MLWQYFFYKTHVALNHLFIVNKVPTVYRVLNKGGKATSPAQLPNPILPICGSARSKRVSEPPCHIPSSLSKIRLSHFTA